MSLPKVPEAAASAYAAATELTARVDAAIFDRDDTAELLGGNPVAVAAANHHHHHLFMSTVLRLNNPELLRETLHWAYRAYRGRGFRPEYFEHELRAWRDAVDELLATTDAEPIRAWYDWMLAEHPRHVEAAYGEVDAPPAPALDAGAGAFLEAALKGELQVANRVVGDAVARGGLARAYLDVITPAMVEVGRLWETGAITVAHEHLVTTVANRALANTYELVTRREPGPVTCVVTAAPNEVHELGARMVSDLLRVAGYRSLYLGANTPADAVVALLAERDAALLAVSVAMPFHLLAVAELIAAVRADPRTRATKILVGGNSLQASPDTWQALGADGSGCTAQDAVDRAGRLLNA